MVTKELLSPDISILKRIPRLVFSGFLIMVNSKVFQSIENRSLLQNLLCNISKIDIKISIHKKRNS